MIPTVGSLCTGTGALDGALVSVLGGVLSWYSEIEPAACKLLEWHHPGVPNLGDLKTVDWELARGFMLSRRSPTRNDPRATAMYERYQAGLSLAEVGAEFSVSRQTVWKMFSRRQWQLRPPPVVGTIVEYEGRRFSYRQNGYWMETSASRDYLHRVVWETEVGSIPSGHDVHHLDHDTSNNVVSNLECLPHEEHTAKYGLWRRASVDDTESTPETEAMPTDSPAVNYLTAGYP